MTIVSFFNFSKALNILFQTSKVACTLHNYSASFLFFSLCVRCLFFSILLDPIFFLDSFTRPGPKTTNAFFLLFNKRFSLLIFSLKSFWAYEIGINFQTYFFVTKALKSINSWEKLFYWSWNGIFSRLQHKSKLR